jgi:hypothetical protein
MIVDDHDAYLVFHPEGISLNRVVVRVSTCGRVGDDEENFGPCPGWWFREKRAPIFSARSRISSKPKCPLQASPAAPS